MQLDVHQYGVLLIHIIRIYIFINSFTTNNQGKGPAWANSLFEDNAEFGYGMYLSYKQRRNYLYNHINDLLKENKLVSDVKDTAEEYLKNFNKNNTELTNKFENQLIKAIEISKSNEEKTFLKDLLKYSDIFNNKSQWIIGGDGWAYDIGYGGLDHVLATGDNVNILVLDTEMYSNTGGQASKSSPRSSVEKFTSTGKHTMKKDLGAIAMTYGNVYVAQIAVGSSMKQTIQAIQEAEEYNGPSIIIAYCTCIGHGIKQGLEDSINEQKKAVDSGYWLLYRYNPNLLENGENPFKLDSHPKLEKLPEFIKNEVRFSSLKKINPKECEFLQNQLINDCKNRYNKYLRLSKDDE